MNRVNRELILQCLEELSNRQLQENLWMGRTPQQQSSFVEAVEGLFTDSCLDDELERGTTGLSAGLEVQLRQLGRQLAKVDENREPEEIINDSAMVPVRNLAAVALGLLKDEMNTDG
jgi:hypothetical protein